MTGAVKPHTLPNVAPPPAPPVPVPPLEEELEVVLVVPLLLVVLVLLPVVLVLLPVVLVLLLVAPPDPVVPPPAPLDVLSASLVGEPMQEAPASAREPNRRTRFQISFITSSPGSAWGG